MQTYTQAQLEQKSLKELKEIAAGVGALPQGDARIKANWITAILNVMPVKVEAPVVEETQLIAHESGYRVFFQGKHIGDIAKTAKPYFVTCDESWKACGGIWTIVKTQQEAVEQLKQHAHNFTSSVANFYKTEWKIDEGASTGQDEIETSNTVEESAPSDKKVEAEAKTCADCPLFQSFDDGSGRGLCCGADRVAREHHQQTQDCLHLIEASQEENSTNTTADYPASCIKSNPGYGMGYEHPYWIDGWDILFEVNLLQHGMEDMRSDCWVNFNNDNIWLSDKKESAISVLWTSMMRPVDIATEIIKQNQPSDTKVEEEANQYTLLPAGATELQTAYHVRHQGSILGMIFHMHHSNTWQCGDGFDYKYPRDASNALWKLDEAPLLKIKPDIYQSPDGALQIAQRGELGTRKLWINNTDFYYYASYRDAEKSANAVATRCDDVKIGDKIYVAGYSRIVSDIKQVPYLGINWTKFVCADGIEIKAPWYCPVQIAAFPSHEACLVA
jgi:hypothetical protein